MGYPSLGHAPAPSKVYTRANSSRSWKTAKARRPSPVGRCQREVRAGGAGEEKREEGTRALSEPCPSPRTGLRTGFSYFAEVRPLRPAPARTGRRPRPPSPPTSAPPAARAHLGPASRAVRAPPPPHLRQAAASRSTERTEGESGPLPTSTASGAPGPMRARRRRARANESAPAPPCPVRPLIAALAARPRVVSAAGRPGAAAGPAEARWGARWAAPRSCAPQVGVPHRAGLWRRGAVGRGSGRGTETGSARRARASSDSLCTASLILSDVYMLQVYKRA